MAPLSIVPVLRIRIEAGIKTSTMCGRDRDGKHLDVIARKVNVQAAEMRAQRFFRIVRTGDQHRAQSP